MIEAIPTPHRIGEKSFSDDEISKLFAVCQTLEEKLMLSIELAYGLRREDCAELLIENIDLDNNILQYIEHKKHVKEKDASGKRVSTDKRYVRSVFIGPQLRQMIQMYLNSIDRKKGKVFDCTGRTLYNHLQELCDRAGIPQRPFHALRSTCIKRHLRSGWTISQVANLVNDSTRVVEEHYIRPSIDEMRELTTKQEVI